MRKHKLLKISLSLSMILGLFLTLGGNDTVSAATDPSTAPSDWAFTEDSVPLHDAIKNAYPNVDGSVDGVKDGYISKDEAATLTGDLFAYDQDISGTMNGIQYFTSVSRISLSGNKLTGSIPEEIGNIENLTLLFLFKNELTGNIPESIGELSELTNLQMANNKLTGSIPESIGSLKKLKRLDLFNNQLSGSIPSSIGDLENLEELYIQTNQLTGEIPESIGNLNKLSKLYIQNNQLSGEIPESMGTMESLSEIRMYNNPLLGGNIAEIFADSTSIEIIVAHNTSVSGGELESSSLIAYVYYPLTADGGALVDGITSEDLDALLDNYTALESYFSSTSDPLPTAWRTATEAQVATARQMLTARDAVEALLNETGDNLADGVTTDDISAAQDLVDLLPDGSLKSELQETIDTAQGMLDAKDAVEALYNDDGKIKDSVLQSTIDGAQDLVNMLPDGALKTELQDKINEAQSQLDERTAKEKVDNLFNDDKSDLADGVTQTDITDAQEAVNKLPEGELKDELQSQIDLAQDMLDAKDKTNNLFDENGVIKGEVTQEDINDAQEAVNKLPDGDLKDELQDKIDEAQKQLDEREAEKAVEDLFKPDGSGEIKDETTQKEIDDAQDLVNNLPDGEKKDELQDKIDEAQKQLDEREAEKAVEDLFKPDGSGEIKDETTQKEIDDAQDLVNNLPDGEKKDELQDKIDEAQKQLDEREAEKAVEDLFGEDGKIKDTVTQEDIDNAQDLVNNLPDGDKKKELQDKLNEAQKQLDEKAFVVVKGFATFTGKGTVSATIDASVAKFANVYVDGKLLPASNYVVTSGSVVLTLNENYLLTLANGTYDVVVEFESGAKVSIPLVVDVASNPSTAPTTPGTTNPSTPVQSPSTSTGSTTTVSNVSTGDYTNTALLMGMLISSFAVAGFFVKKRKSVK